MKKRRRKKKAPPQSKFPRGAEYEEVTGRPSVGDYSPTPRVPFGCDELAKELGRRIRFIRQARGVDVKSAAKQTTFPFNKWTMMEDGLLIPAAQFMERLARWAVGGEDFSGLPPPLPRRAHVIQYQFRKIVTHLGPTSYERLQKTCMRLGFSQDEFIAIAVERLLDNEPLIGVMSEAVDMVRKTNLNGILAGDPGLVAILRCDLDLAVKLGADLMPAKANPALPIDQVVERLHFDGKRLPPESEAELNHAQLIGYSSSHLAGGGT